MPKITLHLDIEIHDYPDVVKNHKGWIAGMLARLPMAGTHVESRVDSEIVARVKSSLGTEVASSLQDHLSKNGVKSRVSYSFQD